MIKFAITTFLSLNECNLLLMLLPIFLSVIATHHHLLLLLHSKPNNFPLFLSLIWFPSYKVELKVGSFLTFSQALSSLYLSPIISEISI